jgi:hypothetical protein
MVQIARPPEQEGRKKIEKKINILLRTGFEAAILMSEQARSLCSDRMMVNLLNCT